MRLSAALVGLLAVASPHAAFPQGLTPDDIVSSLGGSGAAPSPSGGLSTESIVSTLGGAPAAKNDAAGQALFDKVQEKARTRSFTVKDREEVQTYSGERPKVSIEVYFDYNSATITEASKATLNTLGQALRDPRLAGKQFIFRGHTDARGNPSYNDVLSDRRAEAVKMYIVNSFGVNQNTIASIGDGSRNLKNPGNPFADENRKVEVVRSD